MSDRPKLNLLVAYPYVDSEVIRLVRDRESEIRFLLDSGAFTAWKSGRPIALDAYCKFIESLPFKPWRYFSLDVVGDPHASMQNYQAMLARGFKPVPIFTRGEDPSVIEDYYKTSDVVGIGGLVGTIGNKGFVKGIMNVVGTRRVHLLGFTALPFLKIYRPYMADSSSWENGARFASCPLYIGRGSKLVQLNKAKIRDQLKDESIRMAIAREGFDPDGLLKNENWAGGFSISRRLGAHTMRRMSEEIGEKLGTHLFLAAATAYAAKLLLGGDESSGRKKENNSDPIGRNGLDDGSCMGEVAAG